MLDSGTPFFISKEIAWTVEFPKEGRNRTILKTHAKNSIIKSSVVTLDADIN